MSEVPLCWAVGERDLPLGARQEEAKRLFPKRKVFRGEGRRREGRRTRHQPAHDGLTLTLTLTLTHFHSYFL